MPYIKSIRRPLFDKPLKQVLEYLEGSSDKASDFSYISYRLAQAWYYRGTSKCHQGINDIIGCFNCASMELYRRFITEDGAEDVYCETTIRVLPEKVRDIIDSLIEPLLSVVKTGENICAVDLNYVLTKIAIVIVRDSNEERVINVHRSIAAMRTAGIKFYGVYASPYEDLKIEENGDVY